MLNRVKTLAAEKGLNINSVEIMLNLTHGTITERTAKECTRKAELIKAQHLAGVEEKIAVRDTLGGIVDAYIAEVGQFYPRPR